MFPNGEEENQEREKRKMGKEEREERKTRRVGMGCEKEGKEKKENYGFSLILWFSRHENVVPKVSRMWDYKQIQGSLMYSRF